MTTTAEYIARTQAAMLRSQPTEHDWTGWPVDVVEYGELFCKMYHFKPPYTKPGKAFWIASLRELVDASAEFGINAVVEQRKAFKAAMQRKRDRGEEATAPFTVDSPKSIVNDVRGTAARMRENGYVVQKCTEYDESDPGSRYVTGKYANWIEH